MLILSIMTMLRLQARKRKKSKNLLADAESNQPEVVSDSTKLHYLAVLRPRQWTKNLVAFAAPLFAFSITFELSLSIEFSRVVVFPPDAFHFSAPLSCVHIEPMGNGL